MEKQNKPSLIEAKQDELHYLNQIYKYSKYLEHAYKSGKLADKKKALHMENSLIIINHRRKTVKKEIEELTNKTNE